ncbi:MAG TPA: UDP-N-acetylmuramoyl-L-alanyl-D-glutamate--2,6-diaminopimelate ligase [Thermoanaerobaculia bacterium]|nr:UDP-N-acetylmuramoyl-L-alanyl-D-glutamate--2,6-diaminopimelate ligase [Thermoanaerobaculia bacterium]
MKLRDLLPDVPIRETHGNLDADILAVVADSRLAVRGSLFVAIPGLQHDGAGFIPSAIEKGAVAVVAQTLLSARPQTGVSVAHIEVDDPRAALALIAANFYGHPADKLSLVGVTGTSGKTTTTKMLESIFDATGEPAGLIGTIEYRAGDARLMADRTTPDAVILQQWFAKMVEKRVQHAVMEVSSHALALKRTYGIHFAAAVFTNLSQDHFDFHKDFEDYYAAKRTLFDQIESANRAVINIDDAYGRRLIQELGPKPMTFGERGDIRPAKGFEISTRGLRGTLHSPSGDIRVDSALLGRPNLYNWMAAAGAGIVLGMKDRQIEAGIRNLHLVRGRFEVVESDGGPTVIVDYAHKPDALEKLLHAVRDLAGKKRVVVLFGCGGDRDRDKRPKMGKIATELADFTILTSDNPRSEKPDAIIDDIERGARTGSGKYVRITDRRDAIARAIDAASDDDVIVIAGKGHESYQVIGDQVIHFDDREEAELVLKKRHEKTA